MNGLAWFSLHVRTTNLARLERAIARWNSLAVSLVDFSSGHPVVDILWKWEKRGTEWSPPLVNIRLDREADVAAAIRQIELRGSDDE